MNFKTADEDCGVVLLWSTAEATGAVYITSALSRWCSILDPLAWQAEYQKGTLLLRVKVGHTLSWTLQCTTCVARPVAPDPVHLEE